MTAVRSLRGSEVEAALVKITTWQDPQVLGYHHVAYQRLLDAVLGDELHALAVEVSGRLAGLLAYRVISSPLGTVLNAFPFFGCTGLIAAEDAEIQAALVRAFEGRARNADAFSATLYSPLFVDPAPFIAATSPDDVVVKFTQCLDLSLLTDWPAKRRSDVRRAWQRGYTVRRAGVEDLPRLTTLYEVNCRTGGIPMKPFAWMAGTLALSNNHDALHWLVAELNGVVQAGLLYGFGPQTASYVLPCVAADERAQQPMALLLNAAMLAARQSGLRYWNFESSPAWGDPVFKYKERWGAFAQPFALLTFYGARGRPNADAVATVRAACPYYFIAPTEQVSGCWPPEIPLPTPYAGLSPFLRAA